jgi:FtsP/CotA-like multicopper oxidase with cupredoxin domain
MRTLLRNKIKLSSLLLVVLLLFLAVGSQENVQAISGIPSSSKTAGILLLPATPCVSTGTNVTCDLWAEVGSTLLPDGASVTIWGYSATDGGVPALPGPVLIVNQGDTVTVNLTNHLLEPTALHFQGQDMLPDTTGLAAGASAAYVFTAANPGTYLYEAGPLSNAQHQVAMGMYGALIVRPLDGLGQPLLNQAYAGLSTAFDDEFLVVLSTIDPALNSSLDPASFDMRNFAAKYRLINGKAYPNTDPILTTAGLKVLLRYINADLLHHSMTLLGLHQTVIANDGSPFTYSHRMVAETIGPGQTADMLVDVPLTVAPGSQFALYDGSMMLKNSSAADFGGMLTFMIAAGIPGGPGPGPSTTSISLTPNPTGGPDASLVPVTLNATMVSNDPGGLTAAEYFEGAIGINGSGCPMAVSPVSIIIPISGATAPCVDLTTLASGKRTFYVHGQDATGWGPINFAVLTLDKTGPATSGLNLMPNPTNGSMDVALTATGSDQANGNSAIAAAEYFIDGAMPGTPMTVNITDAVASLDAVIMMSIVDALAQGPHAITVHSQDSLGNWGDLASIDLVVDKSGNVTVIDSLNPNPNNGHLPVNTNVPAVRVTATATNTGGSTISVVEGFIDVVGADGTGFLFIPSDGLFNNATETAYADIPLTTVVLLADGPHNIFVHSKSLAGNWGATTSMPLIVDKTSPVVSGIDWTPNPMNAGPSNNTSFTLIAQANDGGVAPTNIVRAEWFDGNDPGIGNGNPMTGTFDSPSVNLSATVNFVALGWSTGNHTVYVRALDAAGNWGSPVARIINVVMPNDIFADGFEAGNFSAWNGGATGARISATPASALVGGYGMQAVLGNGTAPGFVTDLTPINETSYSGQFYFDPNGVLTGNNNVVTILNGMNQAGTSLLRVEFRRQITGGGTYQIRAAVRRAGGNSNTNWFSISNAPHTIQVNWMSANPASFSLYIDGVLRQTINGLVTTGATYLLERVDLGPSAGLAANASGTMYFDAYASARRVLVPPILNIIPEQQNVPIYLPMVSNP